MFIGEAFSSLVLKKSLLHKVKLDMLLLLICDQQGLLINMS